MRRRHDLCCALLRSAGFAAFVFLGAIVAGCLAGEDAGAKVVARHASFEDFVKGTCGNSGANVYVSRKGRVQVINKWDLNKDGYVDVIIPNDHGMTEVADALIYWNGPSGFRSLMPELLKERPMSQVVFGLLDGDRRHFTRLPAFGGGRAIVADLNRDGFPDIVFCNYIHNYPGVRSAFIYWGGQDGYKPNRKTELPTNWASGVAAADLNGDGYLDLVFANNGTEPDAGGHLPRMLQRCLHLLEQSDGLRRVTTHALEERDNLRCCGRGLQRRWPSGYRLRLPKSRETRCQGVLGQREELRRHARGRRARLRPDQPPGGRRQWRWHCRPRGDREGDSALIFFGGPNGLAATPAAELSAPGARAASIADLNRDGSPDIAFAIPSRSGRKSTNSLVYWGSKNGFSPDRRTELPTLGAEDVAAADLNGDGHPDLVFANSGDDVTYDVNSYIYWGSPTGFAPYMRSELQGFGAVSVTVAELNGDGKPDILLVNRNSGVDYGKGVASNIFWGNPHNYYSTASMTSLPTHGPYGIVAADLDDDGYTDILFTRTSDVAYGGARNASSYLYRGGPDGFATARRGDIPVSSAYTVHAADLNRDGYLDLVFAGEEEGKPAGIILWGGPDGYTAARKTVLPLLQKRVGGHQIADLNRDGYLDLIFTAVYIGDMEIFWGGKDGYSTQNHEVFKVGAGMPTLADLNGDGQLDFILGGELDPQTKRNNGADAHLLGSP